MLRNLIPTSWKVAIEPFVNSSEFSTLNEFLAGELAKGANVFPPANECFAALDLVPPEKVKVIIVGQDPYHGEGEAHGLAFSVKAGIKIPPSLRNILTELQSDLGCEAPTIGDLTSWAERGVLLLNSTLTVEKDKPGSHFNKGWEVLTDQILKHLAESDSPRVFILWGAKAQAKKSLISKKHHLVLESPHPSPLSSYRGFFGSKPFSKTNEFLKSQGISPISWCLPGKILTKSE